MLTLASSLTTTAKAVLLVVAIAFIVYSLVVALVIPKRDPAFPGRHLGAFITISVLFFVAQMGTVWWATGQEAEGAHEAAETTETTPTETTPTETAPTETAPTETTPTETTPAGGGDASAGKTVYASAGCGSCHALADAGSTGAVGPDLDESQPSYELVVDRVTNGQGVMPAFAGQLSEQEIADVATYVSSVAGS